MATEFSDQQKQTMQQFLLPRRMDSSSILFEIEERQEAEELQKKLSAPVQKFSTTRPIIMPKTQTNLLDMNVQDEETLVA